MRIFSCYFCSCFYLFFSPLFLICIFIYLFLCISTLAILFLIYFIRFGGRQIHASEDDGSVNHALVRDLEEDAIRLEQFGAELEGDWVNENSIAPDSPFHISPDLGIFHDGWSFWITRSSLFSVLQWYISFPYVIGKSKNEIEEKRSYWFG